MTAEEIKSELDKFTSKIRIAEEVGTYVVLTPAEAKQLLRVLFPNQPTKETP